jgi:hypothetical protein
MSQSVVCLACKYKLRVPSRLAGKRVTCPKCGQAVQVPELAPPSEEEIAAKQPAPDPNLPAPEVPLSAAERLGRAGLMLGLVAFLTLFFGLCLGDYAHWGSAILSGFGLFLSFCGLVLSGMTKLGRRLRGKPPSANQRRDLPVSYPIAGTAACAFVFWAAIWPWWKASMEQQPRPRAGLPSLQQVFTSPRPDTLF